MSSSANVKEFIDDFIDTLLKINSKNINSVVLGDLDINILQHDIESAASYINMLHSNNFFSLLNKPTCVTDSSSTLIDHLITNIINCQIVPGIIDYQITDYLPTFIAMSNIKNQTYNNTKVYRYMKQFDSFKFCQDLQMSLEKIFDDMPELDLLNFTDAFHHFLNAIQTVINTHAPLKRCSRRQKKLERKSWTSKGLYVS